MSRTSKTNHVMSLVGEKSKAVSGDNAADLQKSYRKPAERIFNPAVIRMEEDLKSENSNRELTPPFSESEKNEKSPGGISNNPLPAKETEDPDAPAPTAESGEKPRETFPKKEEREKERETEAQKGITAVVPDLVNQELEAIVRRFNIEPTDSNLWLLTKSALETIRPEFSLNRKDYEEKCLKLRKRVIMEMTKAAIGISKNHKKK